MNDQLDGDAERLKYLRMEWDTPERHEQAKCDGEFNETFLLRLLREKDAEIGACVRDIERLLSSVSSAEEEVDRLNTEIEKLRELLNETAQLRDKWFGLACDEQVSNKWREKQIAEGRAEIERLKIDAAGMQQQLFHADGEITRLRSASAARVVEAARELVQSKRFPRTTEEILADHYSLVEALAEYDTGLVAKESE